MSFLIIQILSLAIYLAILWQFPGNPLPISCQSSANPLAILCPSPVNPVPSPWQSSDNPQAIICQSPGNPQPISLQSCAKLEHIHRNSRQSPGNPLSITIFWQSTCNRMTILWQIQIIFCQLLHGNLLAIHGNENANGKEMRKILKFSAKNFSRKMRNVCETIPTFRWKPYLCSVKKNIYRNSGKKKSLHLL